METLTLRNSASSVKETGWDFFFVVEETMIWQPGRGDKGENSRILCSRVLYFLLWQETVRKDLTSCRQLRWKRLYQLHLLNVRIIQDCKDNDLETNQQRLVRSQGTNATHLCITQAIHNSGTVSRLGGGRKAGREGWTSPPVCLGEKKRYYKESAACSNISVCSTLIPALGSNKRTALRDPAATAWGGISCLCQAFKAS